MNTNTGTEHAQKMEDTKERVVESVIRYSVSGSDMSNVKNLPQPTGLPPDDKAKAKREVDEGRGGFFGYGAQVSKIVRASADAGKGQDDGEKSHEEIKKTAGNTATNLSPAIIQSDYPGYMNALAEANIILAQTTRNKPAEGGAGASMLSSEATRADVLMYESVGGIKNDEVEALISLMAPVWEEEKAKDERRKKSTESASPAGMDLQAYLAPGEALHRIAQDCVRIVKLKNEIAINQSRLMDLRATKVLLLGRLTTMEGEIFAARVNEFMEKKAAMYDSGVYEQSTHRGTGN